MIYVYIPAPGDAAVVVVTEAPHKAFYILLLQLPVPLQLLGRQHLYCCTSKASKLSTAHVDAAAFDQTAAFRWRKKKRRRSFALLYQ